MTALPSVLTLPYAERKAIAGRWMGKARAAARLGDFDCGTYLARALETCAVADSQVESVRKAFRLAREAGVAPDAQRGDRVLEGQTAEGEPIYSLKYHLHECRNAATSPNVLAVAPRTARRMSLAPKPAAAAPVAPVAFPVPVQPPPPAESDRLAWALARGWSAYRSSICVWIDKPQDDRHAAELQAAGFTFARKRNAWYYQEPAAVAARKACA